MIKINENLSIGEDELSFHFTRASGPGGQNVNKVETAVLLRFDALNSPGLPEAVRTRLLKLAGSRATLLGEIIIDARRYRSQEKNREDAVERLVALIQKSTEAPKPRKKTRPTLASRERRLTAKKREGELKKNRKPVKDGD